MACTYCYTDFISCGTEELTIHTGGDEGTEYEIILTHPQGNKYSRTGTVDAFGDVEIDLTSFPTGFFNPYAGIFRVEVNFADCEDFLFCDYYKYLQFEVVAGDNFKNYLYCCPPDSGNTPTMTCCTTTTIPFANETSTTVNYTGTRPTIEVAYLNPDGVSYTLGSMGISTLVTFTGNSFTIDHGGLASGLIKLLK